MYGLRAAARTGRQTSTPSRSGIQSRMARRNGASDGCNARRLGGRCAPPSRRGPTSLRSSGPSAAAPRATEARPQGAFCEELLPEIRQLVGEPVFTGEGYRKIWARLRHKGVRTAKDRVLQLLREHPQTFRPMGNGVARRTTPELRYLETRWASWIPLAPVVELRRRYGRWAMRCMPRPCAITCKPPANGWSRSWATNVCRSC